MVCVPSDPRCLCAVHKAPSSSRLRHVLNTVRVPHFPSPETNVNLIRLSVNEWVWLHVMCADREKGWRGCGGRSRVYWEEIPQKSTWETRKFRRQSNLEWSITWVRACLKHLSWNSPYSWIKYNFKMAGIEQSENYNPIFSTAKLGHALLFLAIYYFNSVFAKKGRQIK